MSRSPRLVRFRETKGSYIVTHKLRIEKPEGRGIQGLLLSGQLSGRLAMKVGGLALGHSLPLIPVSSTGQALSLSKEMSGGN